MFELLSTVLERYEMYSSCTVESYPTNLSREVTAISTPGDRRYSVSSFVSEAETNQELEYFIPPPEGFSNSDTVKSCNIIQRYLHNFIYSSQSQDSALLRWLILAREVKIMKNIFAVEV